MTAAEHRDAALRSPQSGSSPAGEPREAGSVRKATKKKARTRTGCWNCRRRRKKCNERRPTCSQCLQKRETCEWGMRLSFRDENVQTIPDTHPSMLQHTPSRRPGTIEVVDITSEIIRDYWNEVNSTDSPSDESANKTSDWYARDVDGTRNFPPGYEDADICTPSSGKVITSTAALPQQPTFLPSPANARRLTDTRSGSTNTGFGGASHDSPASVHTSHSYEMVQSAAVQLLDLGAGATVMSPFGHRSAPERYAQQLLPTPPQAINDVAETAPVTPEQLLADDGIFLPGSTYLELHSALRHHIFDTARSNYPSRRPTPRPFYHDADAPVNSLADLPGDQLPYASQRDAAPRSPDSTPRCMELTRQEEYTLWKNWVDEIAPWLDKFDDESHFRQKLPALAKEHSHLRLSMLALSARQLERKYPERSSSASLSLYQEAIHQLIPQLQTRSTEVVASCVVLCVLEMMSCSPPAWRRHLDGAACLMQSLGMNGFSGGMEQALFWCFARMDVCGGLISSEPTLIPSNSWTPKMPLSEAVELFRRMPGFDMYANFVVFLCSQALELFACEDSDAEFTRRWNELFAHIENWYSQRPPEMRSILSQPPSSDNAYGSSPFPTLLFSNAPAISGNQLYHTVALLMLQKKPRRATLSSNSRPVLWHARRICAISISNTHHGCWTNCVQPLWIAGQVMSHHTEHQAILETYAMIERETGWGAQWRAEDLKTHWNQLDEG